MASSCSPRPNILAISLDYEDMAKQTSKHLWDTLSSHANILFATSIPQAAQLLGSSPKAVLLTDAAVAKGNKYRNLCNLLSQYVQGGGRVIMCCVFSSFVSPPEFDKWMEERWGLKWLHSSYQRTDFFLNPAATNLCENPGLPASYSMKAACLKGVQEQSKIYQPTNRSVTQSDAVPPEHVDDQAAVAFEKVGNGWVGYVGDVNSEVGSTAIVMAMCGLVTGDACFFCEKTAAEEGSGLLRCARCHRALYCSQACQKTDWKRHKAVCKSAA